MAKRKYVKGKSTKELLKIDPEVFNKLKTPELREVVSRLADAANKRLNRLHYPTPASIEAGGRFSVKNKNLNQLRGEFIRVKNFLESETSTNKGMENFISEIKERVRKETGIELSTSEFFDFWDIYKGFYHDFPALFRSKNFKYETWRIINESTSYTSSIGKSRDEILREIRERVIKEYEDLVNQNGQFTGVSDLV